jgi:hypothetical protein
MPLSKVVVSTSVRWVSPIPRQIRFTPIAGERFAAELEAGQVSPDISWLLNYLFSEVLVEGNAAVADGVRQALGRAPRDFATTPVPRR